MLIRAEIYFMSITPPFQSGIKSTNLRSKIFYGSDPGTEWHGYYPFSRIATILNPYKKRPIRIIQFVFITTATENLKKEDFPFFVNSWEKDTPRAMRSRELLSTVLTSFILNINDTKWN